MLKLVGLRKEAIALADLAALQQILGISFNDPSLLEQALVHSSYINENPGFASTSNERLEFLGDAILDFVVAEKLYQDFPRFTEGEMTRLRAALVRQDTLTRIARAIGLGDCLYLGKGEEASGGRDKPTNLAGALEAVIAAIYLDQGLAATKGFILSLFDKELKGVVSQGAGVDYKSQLQELIQARQQQTPTYHMVEAIGPDHDRKFTVEVRVGDTVLGKGSGRSKKLAETEAARSVLKRLLTNFTQ
ncbi:MAG: ribonuclease III [Dehalococcoidales bacterium]|nr:ribonuclease III [Dehalococcoidales bacterium]